MSESNETKTIAVGVAIVAVPILSILGLWMWLMPQYHIYQQSMSGKAKLAEAEGSRQVAIAEAHAKMESAKMLAQAEIERARGVAQANQIIGESLGGDQGEAYLRYLWIQGLEHGSNDVIYVPTEANLPIMEAGRRAKTQKPEVAVP